MAPLSDEQKRAASERMKAYHAAKKNKQTPETNKDVVSEEQSAPTERTAPVEHSASDPTTVELINMVQELKKQLDETTKINQAFLMGTQASGAQVSRGRLVGTTEKYSVNPTNYADPRPRLMSEARLKRVAFDTNYELGWTVTTSQYETKDGLMMKEPQFELRLIQKVLDDEGDETNRRIGKARMVFFEDPQTAVVIANQYGLPVDESNEADFLNEMRYIRVRDWLFECFWPPRPDLTKTNKAQMVVGGQVVETWEVSTEGSARIPFDELGSKLKV